MDISEKSIKQRTAKYKELFQKRLLQGISSVEILNAILNRDVHFDEGFELTEEEIEDMIKKLDDFNLYVARHRGNKRIIEKKPKRKKKAE